MGYGLQVPHLAQSLGLHLAAPDSGEHRVREQLVELLLLALPDQPQAVFHIVLGNGHPLPVQEQQFPDQPFRQFHVLEIPLDDQLVAPGNQPAAQALLHFFQIFIRFTQDRHHFPGVLEFKPFFRHFRQILFLLFGCKDRLTVSFHYIVSRRKRNRKPT